MRKLILVSATSFEIEPTLQFLSAYKQAGNRYHLGDLQIVVCITGVGMVNTAFELGRLQGQEFDLAINAGLAGSFVHHKNGSLVTVNEDCFSDLGAEDDLAFLSIDELGFGQQNVSPAKPLRLAYLDQIPSVRGITVNTVHGNDQSISKIIKRHSPEIESMEGAAFFTAANCFGWTCLQIRAISNKVEKRNRDNWEIPKAIKELNAFLIALLPQL